MQLRDSYSPVKLSSMHVQVWQPGATVDRGAGSAERCGHGTSAARRLRWLSRAAAALRQADRLPGWPVEQHGVALHFPCMLRTPSEMSAGMHAHVGVICSYRH